jgi:hypothetical protein
MRARKGLCAALATSTLLWAVGAGAALFSVGSGTSVDLGTTTLNLGQGDLAIAGSFDAGSGGGALGLRNVSIEPGGFVSGGSTTIELCGAWTNGGTFFNGLGTVSFVDGCGSDTLISGNSSFLTLQITTGSGRTHRFAAGSTTTVTGLLGISGEAGLPLLIRSTVPGSEAFLNLAGGQTVAFFDVQDNHTTGIAVILDAVSTTSGNTVGWLTALGDQDGDGLANSDEVFLYATNALLGDTDGDGLLDGPEVTLGTDPLDTDTDNDLICDGPNFAGGCEAPGPDNCPLVPNVTQANGDVLPEGNDCQCGDVTGDGVVTTLDVARAGEVLVGRAPGGSFVPKRCNVVGPSLAGVGDCTVEDIAFIEQAAGGVVGAFGSGAACDAYRGL